MTNVNDCLNAEPDLLRRPHQSSTVLSWHGRERSAAPVPAAPSNGSSFLLEVSWSESASVGALARHQDTMLLIVPSKKTLGNMKQSGEAPALEEAPTERAALSSHWHKCNTMKPFIYQWKQSQWRMTNAFYNQSHPAQQFIHKDSQHHGISAFKQAI